MVGRSSRKEHVMTYPEDLADKYDLSNLNTIKNFPGRNKFSDDYVNKHVDLVKNSMNFALDMYQKEDWDVFFIYSSALDVVPHFFWNCCDEDDPTYIGDNPHKISYEIFIFSMINTFRSLFLLQMKILPLLSIVIMVMECALLKC